VTTMQSETPDDATALPLRIEPSAHDERSLESLVAWATAERGWLEAKLHRHGALLLRGFEVDRAAQFELFCRAVDPELKRYVGGESPRTVVAGHVYTSTEYPSHLEISLHNEACYAREWPRRLYLLCVEPARHGGETQLADGRKVLAALDSAVRQRFTDKQVMYVRNLQDGPGLGKSWQQTFETEDRDAVEAHCRSEDVEFEWTDFGLRTRAIRPAVMRHPVTGEEAWFNQADQSHVSSRGPRVERSLLRAMSEDELPRHALFGDGSPIDRADLEHVRGVLRGLEVVAPWQRGDLLLLDNVLVSHGRKPFEGERRVLVAMA